MGIDERMQGSTSICLSGLQYHGDVGKGILTFHLETWDNRYIRDLQTGQYGMVVHNALFQCASITSVVSLIKWDYSNENEVMCSRGLVAGHMEFGLNEIECEI